MIDIFQVPAAYPIFSGGYSYVHVSEDGPSLDNMKDPAHNVQWQNPGLHQFSLELSVEPYYLDMTSCMINDQLSSSEATLLCLAVALVDLMEIILSPTRMAMRFGSRRIMAGLLCGRMMPTTHQSFAAPSQSKNIISY